MRIGRRGYWTQCAVAFFVFKDGEQDERVVYVFVMLVRFEDSWQFIKTQVSTNFDEVYQFVR